MSGLVPPVRRTSILYVGEDAGERRRVALELAPVATLLVESPDRVLVAISEPHVIGALVRVEPEDEAAIALLVELRSRRPSLPMLVSSSEARRLPLDLLAQHRVLVGTAPLDRGVLAGFLGWLREALTRLDVRLRSLTPCHPLSPREQEVAQLLIQRGMTQPEVAACLGISRHTVRALVRRILDKTSASSMRELRRSASADPERHQVE